MDTHHKDAIATVVAFVGIGAAVHAGIWFHLFGIPNITILNWPFHYFWFVVGAWGALLVGFVIYDQYATRLDAEKRQLRDDYEDATLEPPEGVPDEPGLPED